MAEALEYAEEAAARAASVRLTAQCHCLVRPADGNSRTGTHRLEDDLREAQRAGVDVVRAENEPCAQWPHVTRRAPAAQRRTMRVSARGYSAPCRRRRARVRRCVPRCVSSDGNIAQRAQADPEWRTRQCPPPAHARTRACIGAAAEHKGAVPPANVGVGVRTANRTQRLASLAFRGRARERTGAHSGRPRRLLRMDAVEGPYSGHSSDEPRDVGCVWGRTSVRGCRGFWGRGRRWGWGAAGWGWVYICRTDAWCSL